LHVVQVATQRVIKSRLSGGFSPRTNPENHHPLARTRFSSAECAGISIDLLMALLTMTAYAKQRPPRCSPLQMTPPLLQPLQRD